MHHQRRFSGDCQVNITDKSNKDCFPLSSLQAYHPPLYFFLDTLAGLSNTALPLPLPFFAALFLIILSLPTESASESGTSSSSSPSSSSSWRQTS
jgi:hypothetical protein